MSGFLDFLDDGSFWSDLAKRAMPSLMTALFVKKPDVNGALQMAMPQYRAMAEAAAGQRAFADRQAQLFNQRFVPGAIAMSEEAQRIGSAPDLDRTAGRITGDYNQAMARAAEQFENTARSRGVDPSSGAYLAGKGALFSRATPGLVHALNTGLDSRAAFGFDARNKALQNFNMKPDYGGASSIASATGYGLRNIADTLNQNYRQEAGDVSEAFNMVMGPEPGQTYGGLTPEQKARLDAIYGEFRTANQRPSTVQYGVR